MRTLYINFHEKKASWDEPNRGYEEILKLNWEPNCEDNGKKWTFCEELMLKRNLKYGFVNLNRTLIHRSWDAIRTKAQRMGIQVKHLEYQFVIMHYQESVIRHVFKKHYDPTINDIYNVERINKEVFNIYGKGQRGFISDLCIEERSKEKPQRDPQELIDKVEELLSKPIKKVEVHIYA